MNIVYDGLGFVLFCLGLALALGGPISLIILACKFKPCKHDWERIAQLNKKVESTWLPGKFLDHGAVICYHCKNCGKFRKVDLSK